MAKRADLLNLQSYHIGRYCSLNHGIYDMDKLAGHHKQPPLKRCKSKK